MSYTSLTPDDRDVMLATIGVSSIEELFRDIPAGVRLGRDLAVPPALAEAELTRHLEELAAKNIVDDISFLGAGIYDHYVPAVVEAPETVNEDPYGAGWLVRIRMSDPSERDALLDAAAYRELLDSQ